MCSGLLYRRSVVNQWYARTITECELQLLHGSYLEVLVVWRHRCWGRTRWVRCGHPSRAWCASAAACGSCSLDPEYRTIQFSRTYYIKIYTFTKMVLFQSRNRYFARKSFLYFSKYTYYLWWLYMRCHFRNLTGCNCHFINKSALGEFRPFDAKQN